MKKISWQGILAFIVTAIALCTGLGAVGGIGADCNSEGIWTKGMRTASVSASNQAELQNAVTANAAIINITKNIALTSTIVFPESGSIDIRGNGQTLSLRNGVSGSVIKYNANNFGLGTDVIIRDLTIRGGKATSGTGGGGGGIHWSLANSGQSTSLTLDNCRIIDNSIAASATSSNGGGIYFNVADSSSYLKLVNCEVSSNDTNGSGGGIYWSSTSTGTGNLHLTIENCQINGNAASSASSAGAGIAFDASNNTTFLNITNSEIAKNRQAGGISIENGSANIKDSAIYENTATGVSGIGFTSSSGNPATLNLTNSTIYGNSVIGSGAKATIKLNSNTSTDINFCTIANNYAPAIGTGIEVATTASLDISNSIIVGNNVSEIQSLGNTKSKGYNVFGMNIHPSSLTQLSSDISNQSMDVVFGDNILKVNRRGTPTLALAENSPAINRVLPATLLVFSMDQRGFPRPGSIKPALSSGDSGAFESGNTEPPTPDPDPEPDPKPKQPAKLSTFVLGLTRNGMGKIRTEASGNWTAGDSSLIDISTSPFPGQTADVESSSGEICYVKSLGKTGVTFIKYENETHIAYAIVRVSFIEINTEVVDKINNMNTGLANSGVGVIIGGNVSGDIDGIGTIIDSISSVDAQVETNAPEMLCYEETGKNSAVIEVQVPDDDKNYVLPMGYTFSFQEDEIKRLSDTVERPVDMDKIFGIDKAAAAEEFFSVFVLQKEIRQGSRKGQLARLMGGSEKQQSIISPTDALNAGILNVSNDNRTFSIEFDFYVIDGDDSPEYNEEYKMLVIGDGEKDGLIVDPLWASMRSASSNENIDGGTGCNAGFAIFALLFLPFIAVRSHHKRDRFR